MYNSRSSHTCLLVQLDPWVVDSDTWITSHPSVFNVLIAFLFHMNVFYNHCLRTATYQVLPGLETMEPTPGYSLNVNPISCALIRYPVNIIEGFTLFQLKLSLEWIHSKHKFDIRQRPKKIKPLSCLEACHISVFATRCYVNRAVYTFKHAFSEAVVCVDKQINY